MMYVLLAVPLAAAMFTMVLGAFVRRDFPQEPWVGLALLAAPAAAFGWAVLGYMMLQPVGIGALWVYVGPFLLAFAAVAAALARLIYLGEKVFPALIAALLALFSVYLSTVMLSGVLTTPV